MTVRIEDTDRARYVPGCEEEILGSLGWLSIEWQEGPDKGGPFAPYRQSERQAGGLYQPFIDQLLASGHGYFAFDTPQELEEMREYQQINKQPVGYFGGLWREASLEQVAAAKAEGKPGVIRLRIPRGRKIVVQDAIRGRVEFDADTLDDPVLIKADGMPTYHFAAMVDDHLMNTTHIIRGEEWISSAPKHVFLFEALGLEPPMFVHVPVIKGKDGSKLSKRHGDTRVLDFRSAGYLPAALVNFVALIGWAPGGDRELMSHEELVEAFDLKGLQPSPGIFDIDKLNWMNGHYIREMSVEALLGAMDVYLHHPETQEYWTREADAEKKVWPKLQTLKKAIDDHPELVRQVTPLAQERMLTLADFFDPVDFFFTDELEYEEKGVEKWFAGQPHVAGVLQAIHDRLEGKESISHDECETLVKGIAAEQGIEKLGPVVHPTRVALTGRTVGPSLWDLMSILGPDRMRARLQTALGMLRS